jgi:putative ABC transport system ATP-binding protein
MSVNIDSPISHSTVAPVVRSENLPLQIQNLSKSFLQGSNTVHALKDVSLSIGKAEFVAIMGASGSGKSTLLNLIAGMTSPDQGSVIIDAVDMTKLKDPALTKMRRRKIGLVFQSFNLIPTLTAQDNILLPVLAGGEQGPLSVDELLERVGLSKRRHHRPDALSGGEQQRVAIARALISNPSIILADEPTGSLDSVNGEIICKLLKDMQKNLEHTIVIVTHEPAVAKWADRIIFLRDGQLLTEFDTADFSTAQDLAAHYQEVVRVPVTGGNSV